LDAGDKDGVVATFLSEVPRVPPEQLERMRSLPAWHARVEAAATIPRELRAHDRYTFAPEKFKDVRVPVLLLLGGDSPPFFRAALERVQAALRTLGSWCCRGSSTSPSTLRQTCSRARSLTS
jgi:hypothetical protein